MSWAEVKKINSDLSTPLNYLVYLKDIAVNEYNSYVFRAPNILKELAINTTELYRSRSLRSILDIKVWREVVAKHKNLGYVLDFLASTGDDKPFPEGNIDNILREISSSYIYLEKEDLEGIKYYINQKLKSNEVGKWINRTYNLNSSEIDSYNTLLDLLKSNNIKLILSNIDICIMLSLSDYTNSILEVPKPKLIEAIKDTIKTSSTIPIVLEFISNTEELLNIALLDENVLMNIFQSIDNIKIIMSKTTIVDKIKNDKDILTLLFDSCPNFIKNFVLKGDLGYYQDNFTELENYINSNIADIKLLIENSENNYITNNLISPNIIQEYSNIGEEIKLDINILYSAIFNSISLLDSQYLDYAVIKSNHARTYMNNSEISNLVINSGLLNKFQEDINLLECFININSVTVKNELLNFEKYFPFLEIEGVKRLFQNAQLSFYTLVRNEEWLSKLMVDQEDYSYVLNKPELRSLVYSSDIAMDRIVKSDEHLEYLFNCGKEVIAYLGRNAKMYKNNMISAKMLMILSDQNSSDIYSLDDITIDHLKIILSNDESRVFLGYYADNLNLLLLKDDIYNCLKTDINLLKSLLNVDGIGKELRNYERYSVLLDIEGVKEIFQSNSNVFSELIKDELWLSELMSNEEDYKFVLDHNKFRGAVYYSSAAMNRLSMSEEHMNYLTKCSIETMDYFKSSSELYIVNMASAKMLIGLSGQDASNINNLKDISLEQFKVILDNLNSKNYIGAYSNNKIYQLLQNSDIFYYLFEVEEGHVHLAEILLSSSHCRNYILGNNGYCNNICNNYNLFKEVIKYNYTFIHSYSYLISNFRSSNIACMVFWDMAINKSYIQIPYILGNKELLSSILFSNSYFRNRLIDVMDYLPRNIYKLIYSNEDMFKHIYSDAYTLSKFLKHDIASDVLITECNIYL